MLRLTLRRHLQAIGLPGVPGERTRLEANAPPRSLMVGLGLLALALSCHGNASRTDSQGAASTSGGRATAGESTGDIGTAGQTPDGAAAEDDSSTSTASEGQSTVASLPAGLSVASIAVDGTYVYLATLSGLGRVRKDGTGELEPLHQRVQYWVHSLGIRGADLLFYNDESLVRFDTQSGSTQVLYTPTEPASVWSLDASGDLDFLVSPGCGAILAVDSSGELVGSATQEVSDSVGGYFPLIGSGRDLYCGGGVGGPTSGRIYRWSPEVSAIEEIAYLGPVDDTGHQPQATALAVVGDELYYTRGFISARWQFYLERMPVSGGEVEVLGEVRGVPPSQLLFDPSRKELYTLAVGESYVVTYSIESEQLSLQQIQGIPRRYVAQDEEYVYWTSEDSIQRLPKL